MNLTSKYMVEQKEPDTQEHILYDLYNSIYISSKTKFIEIEVKRAILFNSIWVEWGSFWVAENVL